MHTDQDGEQAKREEFLVIPMGDESARSVEGPRWRQPASGIPYSIGFWGDPKLGSECRLRALQCFPALAEGLWGHGTTTVPSAGWTWQGQRHSV